MTRYVFFRLLTMLPVLLGVLLLTFFLFHVVGGSPAAVVLGKNATAQALDDYNEHRGFNKPLVWGRWKGVDAFQTAVVVVDAHTLQHSITFPLALSLRQGQVYRMALPRGVQAAEVRLLLLDDAQVRIDGGIDELTHKRGTVRFRVGGTRSGRFLRLLLPAADVVMPCPDAMASIRLFRRNAHRFDTQLVHFLRQAMRMDFGVSSATNQRVTTMLREGLGASLSLTVPIFAGGLVFSVALALVCAALRNRLIDRVIVVAATVLMSVNYVIWVVAGQYLFAYRLGWFPIWGYESWRYLLLPVLIGMVTTLGRDVRFYRTVMLDEMYRDYVRTAEAKGVSPFRVLFVHVLRNALMPIITNAGMAVPFLFTGSILLESFFGIPGLGGISVNAIHSSDLDVVKAVVLIGAMLYMVVNLLADLCYAWADPRVRLR